MMKRAYPHFLMVIMLGMVLLCIMSPALAAFKVPQNQGYVTDLANVMSPEAEQQATAIAQELDEKTRSQIAILTIPREELGDIPVEEASLETARKWGVGSKKAGNTGLLIFMAVSNKAGQSKLRTEIGYGLEGIITDGTSGEIQDRYMIPAFRQGNLDAGILNGMAAYATLIARDKQVKLASLSGQAAPQVTAPTTATDENMDSWLGSALIVFIIMVMLALTFVSMLGKMFHSPYSQKGRYGSRMDDGGLLPLLLLLSGLGGGHHHGGGGGFGGGGFGGFGGGGFGGGGSSRNW